VFQNLHDSHQPVTSSDAADSSDDHQSDDDLMSDLFENNTSSESSDPSSGDSDLSDSCDHDDAFLRENFKSLLARWVLDNHLSEAGTASLLHLLRLDTKYGFLPKTRKTLVKTPVGKVGLTYVSPGVYFHFPVVNGLRDALAQTSSNLDQIDVLKLHVGIDGVKLADSSDMEFWPIVAQVANLEGTKVFPIGVYQGPKKPENVNEYLSDFVKDCVDLKNDGVIFNGKHFKVELDAIICDTPAKAYVAQVLGHAGKLSCFRCNISGFYSKTHQKTYFPTKSGEIRTENDFRNRTQPGHHIGYSILEEIPPFFKLTVNIPYDFMHLILLGVLKKILLAYFYQAKKKLPKYIQSSINKLIRRLRKYVCSDFARKPRELNYLKMFKATELRLFLLYLGPVLFNSAVKRKYPDHYREFMLLHCASVIFCGEKSSSPEFVSYAQKLYDIFVKEFPNLHSKYSVSANVHALLHVEQDVRKYGSFDKFSAFKFENEFRHMKAVLKKNGSFIQQFVKRKHEFSSLNVISKSQAAPKIAGARAYNGVHLRSELKGPCYKTLQFRTFSITTNRPNNCILLKSGEYMLVDQISHVAAGSKLAVCGRLLQGIDDLYTLPMRSSQLNIIKASRKSKTRHIARAATIKSKCMLMPLKRGKFAVFPLLHTSS
jgi:hypothetical protein